MLHRSQSGAQAAVSALAALTLLLFATTSLSQPQEPTAPNERAERGAQLSVQILDEDGKPVSSTVCLRAEGELDTCSSTDRLGIATFFHLGSGSYRVIVFRASQQICTDQITISDHLGAQTETIRLPGSKVTSPTISVRELAVPERARRLYEAGKTALNRGEYSKAEKSFQAALSIYPNFPRARNALAVAYVQRHDFTSAMGQLEIAIDLDPRFGEAYFNYGIVLMGTGRYADAATHLAIALDLEFSPDHVAHPLISSDIHANQPDAAITALRTIHERNFKHHASLHWEVAQFLNTLGRGQDAEAQYRQYASVRLRS